MKNASNIMFRIGRIFNIISIVTTIVFFILGVMAGIVGIIFLIISSNSSDWEELKVASSILIPVAIGLFAGGIYFFISSIVTMIFAVKSHYEIIEGSYEAKPRVILIVFGAISGNTFYVLSGIFSFIARNQESRYI